MDMTGLGQALKYARKVRKMSQEEAALKADITQTYLSLIESGKKSPSLDVLDKFTQVYNMPIQFIMWGSLSESDVAADKREAYKVLKPIIDNLIKELI